MQARKMQVIGKQRFDSIFYYNNVRILSWPSKCKKSGNYNVPKMMKASAKLTLIHWYFYLVR